MPNPNVTKTVIEPGKALVRAIEPSNPLERALVSVFPERVTEQILSASQHVGEDRAVVWFGEN